MTNILATIVIAVTTNVYHPQQHKEVYCYPTNPPQYVERWVDGAGSWQEEVRENPDVRITEIRRKRELFFDFEGQEHRVLLDDTRVSKVTERRTLETKETWTETERQGGPEDEPFLVPTNHISIYNVTTLDALWLDAEEDRP